MHPAYDGLAALPYFDDFDLSTVDILLISQYVTPLFTSRALFSFGFPLLLLHGPYLTPLPQQCGILKCLTDGMRDFSIILWLEMPLYMYIYKTMESLQTLLPSCCDHVFRRFTRASKQQIPSMAAQKSLQITIELAS